MNNTDLKTTYGRLGMHPGDMGPDEATVIFGEAMKLPEGSRALEISPQTGRTTAILGAAIRNIDGALYVADDWIAKNPQESAWFQKAIKLHGLMPSTKIVPSAASDILRGAHNEVGGFNLVLISGNFSRLEWLPLTKGCVVLLRRSRQKLPEDRARLVRGVDGLIDVWEMSGDMNCEPLNTESVVEAPL